jgi:aminoglycoside/choline kinase family phosphotransferase
MNFQHRLEALTHWVQRQVSTMIACHPIPGDASFRRYFRVMCEGKTLIAVDAPPGQENMAAFVAIAEAFAARGLCVPRVFKVDYEQGFMLLSDLGDIQYLRVLNSQNAQLLYSTALHALCNLQGCEEVSGWQLLDFNEQLLLKELEVFKEWYLLRHLGLDLTAAEHDMLTQAFVKLQLSAQEQPQVCVHRDYHSRNLMLLADGHVGIIDFQDAVRGPVTYDLVSLLRDCYIAWPNSCVQDWVLQYYELLLANGGLSNDIEFQQFLQWFDWMGLQRHLKVLGFFARLFHRDGKPAYLQDIPRTLNYVYAVCEKYSELSPLHQFLTNRVMPHESHDTGGRSW